MQQFKKPQDNATYAWTEHAAHKMRQYGLSADRLKRVIRFPARVEESVVEGTVAAMSPYGRSPGGRQPYRGEIWVMYALTGNSRQGISNDEFRISKQQRSGDFDSLKTQIESKAVKGRIRIITAWRYPGISPKRDPVPQEIIDEVRAALF